MTTLLLQVSVNFLPINTLDDNLLIKPISCHYLSTSKIASFCQNRFKAVAFRQKWDPLGKDGVLVKEEGWRKKRRVVLVRFNQGFGFNGGGGGGGGGGRDNSGTARVLGNLALAIGLTYLTMTGQLGGVFDAIGYVFDALISLWLIAFLVPIVGFGAFMWWAGRDIVQSACPNCGNEFQIFKSTINDELQLCPFCSQPFSVVDDKFVRDSVKFSNQSSKFRQPFNDFAPKSTKGKESSSAVVDVEAEIKDAD